MLRNQWKEVSAIGLVSFAVPVLGCTAIARWGLGWSPVEWRLASVFAPFTGKTLVFLGVGAVTFFILPWLVPRFFKSLRRSALGTGSQVPDVRTVRTGRTGHWADSEAVPPAYLLGMVLAGTVGKNHALVRRLRTLTFGLLTPFYFIPNAFFLPRHLLPEGEKS